MKPSRPDFALLTQADELAFPHLQLPRWLFGDARYAALPLEAKVAYALLLNRFRLSRPIVGRRAGTAACAVLERTGRQSQNCPDGSPRPARAAPKYEREEKEREQGYGAADV